MHLSASIMNLCLYFGLICRKTTVHVQLNDMMVWLMSLEPERFTLRHFLVPSWQTRLWRWGVKHPILVNKCYKNNSQIHLFRYEHALGVKMWEIASKFSAGDTSWSPLCDVTLDWALRIGSLQGGHSYAIENMISSKKEQQRLIQLSPHTPPLLHSRGPLTPSQKPEYASASLALTNS